MGGGPEMPASPWEVGPEIKKIRYGNEKMSNIGVLGKKAREAYPSGGCALKITK